MQDNDFASAPVSVRTKLAGLWASVLFVYAYVDLFSLYRPDVRAELAHDRVGGFHVGQVFLLGTLAYILVASLMVAGSLLLPARGARWANVVLAVGYAVTIVAGALGEWAYWIVGSLVEVALLAVIVALAWRWPRAAGAPAPGATAAPEASVSLAGRRRGGR